jgi:hypothetical protein
MEGINMFGRIKKYMMSAAALFFAAGTATAEPRNVCEERDTQDHPMFRARLMSDRGHDYTPVDVDGRVVVPFNSATIYRGITATTWVPGGRPTKHSAPPQYNDLECLRFVVNADDYARIAGQSQDQTLNISIALSNKLAKGQCVAVPVSHAFAEVMQGGKVVVQFKLQETEEMRAWRNAAAPNANCFKVKFGADEYMKPAGLHYTK